MENLIKMDDLGVPLFLETPISIFCDGMLKANAKVLEVVGVFRVVDKMEEFGITPKERWEKDSGRKWRKFPQQILNLPCAPWPGDSCIAGKRRKTESSHDRGPCDGKDVCQMVLKVRFCFSRSRQIDLQIIMMVAQNDWPPKSWMMTKDDETFNHTPPKTNMSPKKGPFSIGNTSSNHWFSGDMLVFRGVSTRFFLWFTQTLEPWRLNCHHERKMLLPQDLYVTDEVYRLVAKGKAFREAGEKKRENEFSSFSWLCRRLFVFLSFHKNNIFRQLMLVLSSTQPIPVFYLTLQGYKASTDVVRRLMVKPKRLSSSEKLNKRHSSPVPKKWWDSKTRRLSFIKKVVPFRGRTVFHFVFCLFKMLLIWSLKVVIAISWCNGWHSFI